MKVEERNMIAEKIVKDFPKGALIWYPWDANQEILYIGKKDDVLYQLLKEKELHVVLGTVVDTITEDFMLKYRQHFGYIIAIDTVEYASQPVILLECWKKLLNINGRLLLGTDNRLGLRYFCGDKDPFTDHVFDGIENYRKLTPVQREYMEGRCYSKAEIMRFINHAGFEFCKTYSVFPSLDMPQLIYADNYLPNEDLSIRYFPRYRTPSSVFMEEERVLSGIIENGLFHGIANMYLFECSMDGKFADINQVTLSLDRGYENALATIIKDNGCVVKQALYPEGEEKLRHLIENGKDLKRHGIQVVDACLKDAAYCMPYYDAMIGNTYFYKLLQTDKRQFIEKMDYFRNLILKSSAHIKEDAEQGIILERGYLDLVPLNSFYLNDEFIFFDQEFYVENCPANLIIYRMVSIVYDGEADREAILPSRFFMERYGLKEKMSYWEKLASEFTGKLRHQQELSYFNSKYERNGLTVAENRFRLRYGEREYQDLFINLFKDLKDKQLYIFGSGKYAEKFIAMYEKDYPISGVFDNNRSKWETEFKGYMIYSPDKLREMNYREYKIIICAKEYEPILIQLQFLGARNISIYDRDYIYPGRQALAIPKSYTQDGTPKKYHIGYIAGVFDLYHIGHLNMFKRAKEQCDYLIAAVVSDDGVRKNKKREPFIPFEERIEMVRSCRYVDEAVEIPFLYGGTVEAYQKYHFDCQFSGSDYVDDPWWMEQKEYLEEHGAQLVFFPYTQQTSSTKIKTLIEKKLI